MYAIQLYSAMGCLVGGAVAALNIARTCDIALKRSKIHDTMDGCEFVIFSGLSITKGVTYGAIWPAFLVWVSLKSTQPVHRITINYGRYWHSINKNSPLYQTYPFGILGR